MGAMITPDASEIAPGSPTKDLYLSLEGYDFEEFSNDGKQIYIYNRDSTFETFVYVKDLYRHRSEAMDAIERLVRFCKNNNIRIFKGNATVILHGEYNAGASQNLGFQLTYNIENIDNDMVDFIIKQYSSITGVDYEGLSSSTR